MNLSWYLLASTMCAAVTEAGPRIGQSLNTNLTLPSSCTTCRDIRIAQHESFGEHVVALCKRASRKNRSRTRTEQAQGLTAGPLSIGPVRLARCSHFASP